MVVEQTVAGRMETLRASMPGIGDYFQRSRYGERVGQPGVVDFAFGNPQHMASAAYVETLQRATVPHDPHWFAYKQSEPYAQEAVAQSLRGRTGLPFEPDDIAMTIGGFGALFAALAATVDRGDEVIVNLPPWFFYDMGIVVAGGTPVKVPVQAETFDLDLAAIEAAITLRTRVILVNTPNNPTGKVYPAETLRGLAEILERASANNERPIYLLSDEPYNRIVFDGIRFRSPAEFYSHTLVAYSYGKTLLAPGQRIGYLALSPRIPEAEREQLRRDLFTAQLSNGFAFPNAVLQRALPELEQIPFDTARLQRKRDRMVSALREIGYSVHVPEGTFYLFPKSPLADDWTFVEMLEARDVFCHPGSISEWPGYFRICLTATEEMIEASIPHFAEVFAKVEAARGLQMI
jgi:aspartate aminotransferase